MCVPLCNHNQTMPAICPLTVEVNGGFVLLALLIHSTKRVELKITAFVMSSQMKGFLYDLFQLLSIAQLLTAEIYTTKSILEGGVMEHTYKVHA